MPQTTFVNSRGAVHKGSGGMSMVFPDVCKTPAAPSPVPIPYPNIGQSADTSQGPTTVKLDGQIRGTIGKVRGPYRIGFPDGQSSREIAVVLWRPGAAEQERRIALSAGDEKSIDLEWTGTP